MAERPVIARSPDVEYTAERVLESRQRLEELRDEAMRTEQFEWAALLFHVSAYLAEFAECLAGTNTALAALPKGEPLP